MPARRSPPREPQTVLRPRPEDERLPPTSFAIVVIEGRNRGDRFAFDGSGPSSVLIGQSQTCEIRLEDSEVSRRHAALELTGSRLRIIDQRSTNGTLLNGVPILDAYCGDGAIVRVGRTNLRVELCATPPGKALPEVTGFGCMIGTSPVMRRLYPLCQHLARSDITVIIEGETGTGKEVLAQALHEMGPRASGPFVVFDCAGVASSLIESELRGHEKGAFTDASERHIGAFERAHKGTLLIDEIGDLDLSLQKKLLRVVEQRKVQRLGGADIIPVDVRLLAATRRDLDREVQAGRFRDDLFNRLALARIEMPPLRSRRDDIPVLVRHFCAQFGATEHDIPKELFLRWQDDMWPGNIRELRNAVERRIELGDFADLQTKASSPRTGHHTSNTLAAGGIPDAIEEVLHLALPLPEARGRVRKEFERRYVERLLKQNNGSVSLAAKASGIALRNFQALRARLRT